MPDQETSQKQQQRRRPVIRRVATAMLIIILAMFSISFIVHIPGVQNWGVRKISTYISQRTNTRVEVGRFDVHVFKHLRLTDLYIADPEVPGDTLLQSGTFYVRFNNLINLVLQRKLELRNITLRNATLTIRRTPEIPENTLTQFLRRLVSQSNPSDTTAQRPLMLAPRLLTMENIRVRFRDVIQATEQDFSIGTGQVLFQYVDLMEQRIGIDYVELSDPVVDITKNTGPVEVVIPQQGRDSIAARSFWDIRAGHVYLNCGQFSYDDWTVDPRPARDYLDYAHLDLRDIQAEFENIRISDTLIASSLERLSLTTETGFEISQFATKMQIDQEGFVFDTLVFQTPRSRIGRRFSLQKRGPGASGDFANRMVLDADFSDSRLSVFDLIHLVPGLEQNAFFTQNQNEVFRLDGRIYGRINRLRGQNVSIALGDMSMKGNFGTRDISDPERALVNLNLNDARFNFRTLRSLLPTLDIPSNFLRLGNIRFNGRFDGYLEDFVAYGNFTTRIGRVTMDMNLDLGQTLAEAEYSGSAKLIDFDLGAWSANPDFGGISMSVRVQDGRGLTAESASATLTGLVEAFEFKQYPYQNIQLNATLQKTLFDGGLAIEDENIALDFTGSVNFRDSLPDLDFSTNIRKLDLYALNISKQPFSVQGQLDIDSRGFTLDVVEGVAYCQNLVLQKDTVQFSLDTFEYVSEVRDGQRYVQIQSDILSGFIQGKVSLSQVHLAIGQHLKKRFSPYFDKWDFPEVPNIAEQDFIFEIHTGNTQGLLAFLNFDPLRLQGLNATGAYSSTDNRMVLNLDADAISYGDIHTYHVSSNLSTDSSAARIQLNVLAADFKEDYLFEEILLRGTGFGDSLTLEVNTRNLPLLVDDLRCKALAERSEDGGTYSIRIVPQSIVILDSSWTLDPANRLVIGPDRVALENVIFTNAERKITIRDIRKRGIQLDAEGFDLHVIDEIWDYDKLDFSGKYALDARIQNLFDSVNQQINVDLIADQMLINADTFGQLQFHVDLPGLRKGAEVDLSIDGPNTQIIGQGMYYPPLRGVDDTMQNRLDLGFDLLKFPMAFFEYFIPEGISATSGVMEGGIRIAGTLPEVNFSGGATVSGGATTVNYLGTRYQFDGAKAVLTNTMVDLTGSQLLDQRGNVATVTGGLSHNRFGKWGVRATIQSPRFMALNTTKQDNPIYYGVGIGALDARFDGLFIRPDIEITATTGEGTYLAIPIESGVRSSQVRFIEFQSTDTVTAELPNDDQVFLTGVNFDMDLAMTNDATVEIIFNERAGDIIRGNGRGNMQLDITRTGEFTMYGDYEIDQGRYLFTNTILNKPFEINRGGTILWSGDPFNAQINITADYIGLRTNLSTFLEEYLVNASAAAQSEASIKTDVQLKLLLTGSLLQPQVDFSIAFPNLAGELSGYADSKLRILEANQNALNEQVFGLLWIGSFLPSNVLQSTAGSTGQLATSGLSNTLSQFLTNQLSLFLSDFLQQAVADVGFISGVDLDIGINRNFDLTAGEFYSSEWEVSLRNRLFDDRVILNLGGNYVTNSPIVSTGEYFAWDYAIEYRLTRDRRLKMRFYNRNEQTIEGRKNKFGIGLSYRREFDTFGEFLKNLRKSTEKLVEEDAGSNY